MNSAQMFTKTSMLMNTKSLRHLVSLVLLALLLAATSAARAASGDVHPNATNAPIAWGDLGAKATAQYSGAGLSVFTAEGAVRLRCAFQKLEGEVTREGLWLSSTVPGAAASRFRVVATSIGRAGGAMTALLQVGGTECGEQQARFTRPGLTEEYSVSADGVQPEFVVAARPAGAGELRVELAVHGAKVEALAGPGEPDAGSGDPAYTGRAAAL